MFLIDRRHRRKRMTRPSVLAFSEYATRQHHLAHSKEFSSVTDEFLPLCRSYLRGVGVCVTGRHGGFP
jgi:hypothetical protein